MLNKRTRHFFQKKEKGQIIVIMALVFVGLVAVVGLAIDMGYLYVSYSRLRRAVDAAALSASSQFREGYTVQGLQDEAKQFLKLNGVAPDAGEEDTLVVRIENCQTNPSDLDLCTNPPRKLIRVSVTQDVPLYFLSIVGIHSAPITVEALSEAASVDLVILIDASTSMALTNAGADADPKGCNQGAPGDSNPGVDPGGAADDSDYAPGETDLGRFPGECHPFEDIKKAAVLLVRKLYLSKNGNPGYDRVSIVTYDRFPHVILEMSDQQTLVEDAIRNLRVYQGEGKCPWPSNIEWYEWSNPADLFEGPCRLYTSADVFDSMWASGWNLQDGSFDPRARTVTNSGGGLKVAGNILGGAYPAGYPTPWPETRQAALWVVVWLTDGYTNSGFANDGAVHPQTIANAGQPICPKTTWGMQGPYNEFRFCADLDARPTVEELSGSTPPSADSLAARHAQDPVGTAAADMHYDADDYARDMIDFVTDPVHGQGAMLFTVGLGAKVRGELTNYEKNFSPNPLPPPGETLLQYGAYKGNGVYYYAPNSNELNEIFLAIANKIATRLSR